MAGIGFEIKKIMRSETYAGILGAYVYAGVISSGPWIISILALVGLTFLLNPVLSETDLQLFTASITYVYAMALILVGPLQLVLTRYAADRISDKTPESVFPSYIAALAITAAFSAALGIGFFVFGCRSAPILYRVAAAALLVYMSCIFITANYLTALVDYRAVVSGFFAGYSVSCSAAYLGGYWGGAPAALCGFTLGHVVLFLLLFYALRKEIGYRVAPDWGIITYFRKFPSLILCGLLYNLGIWIDKIMFWWFSEQHIQISGFMYSVPDYDKAIYLSLLSIVPGLTVFFLSVETDFVIHYRTFFRMVLEGGTLDEIVEARNGIIRSLREGFLTLFIVQAVVTAVLVIFADRLASIVNIGAIQLGIFRITLFGSFLLVVFLSLLTILFYVDDRKGALLSCAVFVISNAFLSLATLMKNEAWYGFGFVVAAGLAMVIAGWRANNRVSELEYYVFSAQR
jgi:uncharacterized membrane protein